MKAEGHTGLALFLVAPIALIAAFFVSEVTLAAFMLLLIVFVNIPDMDVRVSKSIIGKFLGISHRGFTHTIYFATICGLITMGIPTLYETAGTADYIVMFLSGFLGVIFHSLGDIMTPSGVNIVPFVQNSSYSLDWFNFNNIIANLGFLSLGFMSISMVAVYLTQPTAENLIYWVCIYVVFFPMILLSAKRFDYRYESYILSRYFNPIWWIKRIL